RVAIVKKRSPVAHALWLRRVLGVLELADDVVHAKTRDETLLRALSRTDASAVMPPLVPLSSRRAEKGEEDEPALLDLELAAIDHLIAAARAESMLLGRKRRLLLAARQRLLEASAALPIARAGVRERTRYLASEITRIDRL